MDSIREQMELTNEISDAISNPVGMGQEVRLISLSLPCSSPLTVLVQLDDEEIKKELEELEQEGLNERLVGAERVPATSPGATDRLRGPSLFGFHRVLLFCALMRMPLRANSSTDEDAGAEAAGRRRRCRAQRTSSRSRNVIDPHYHQHHLLRLALVASRSVSSPLRRLRRKTEERLVSFSRLRRACGCRRLTLIVY